MIEISAPLLSRSNYHIICFQSTLISELALYDVANTVGVAADLSHIESAAQVKGYVGDSQLEECLQGEFYVGTYFFELLCLIALIHVLGGGCSPKKTSRYTKIGQLVILPFFAWPTKRDGQCCIQLVDEMSLRRTLTLQISNHT